MHLGYNTNGFAHHRIEDALTIIAEIGYRSAAITLEREFFDPAAPDAAGTCVARLKPVVDSLGLRVTIETGSRFLLDPRRKHQPTLLSAAAEARARRLQFLKLAVDVAVELRADSVSLWSGAADDAAESDILFHRLVAGMRELCTYAASRGVRVAFEPEPDMFVETMSQYETLFQALAHPAIGLTLDVGHVHCLNDGSLHDHASLWSNVLWNIHIEDMRRGRHEHLMFGDGDMDFSDTFAALRSIDYAGPIHVELSRHSHDAVQTARRAYDFLTARFFK